MAASTVAAPAISRRRRRADRRARLAVCSGGAAIIACIVGMLVFLFGETLPLLRGARLTPVAAEVDGHPGAGAMLVDEYGEFCVQLHADGVVRGVRLRSGEVVVEQRLLGRADAPAAVVAAASPAQHGLLAGLSAAGELGLQPVDWRPHFDGERARSLPVLPPATRIVVGAQPAAWAASRSPSGALAAAFQGADRDLVLVRFDVEENLLTGETSLRERRSRVAVTTELQLLVIDREQRNLYATGLDHKLRHWPVTPAGLGEPAIAAIGGETSAIALLFGDVSLLVGRTDGGIDQWFAVRDAADTPVLEPIRSFPPLDQPVRSFAHPARNKAFVAVGAAGAIGLYFATSGELRWRGTVPLAAADAVAMSARGDAVFVAGGGKLAGWQIDDPHPEATPASLLLPVFYESYPEPAHVWQSTPGSDAVEPKLGIVPLLFGTMKATLVSLLFAVPLAVAAALYVSQFMSSRWRGIIKPIVELMAALPSVILGFVAAVWLAPRLEHALPGLLAAALLIPAGLFGAAAVAERLPPAWRRRAPGGSALVAALVVVAVCLWLGFESSPRVESLLFAGDFQGFVRERLGLPYEQKNTIVIAIAMGFAVIPIVFSIAEESFAAVPRTLASASLALGASRWHTAARIVLPTASPGVFSAIMVGFGRVVGETMIVLMAVGNTPIISWNPFDGFRTLAANIATEIPEAPQGGTLYRVLFLTATLLFLFTFVVNTVAELVRQRLRVRYAGL